MKTRSRLLEEALDAAKRFSPELKCHHCEKSINEMNVDTNGEWISIKDLKYDLEHFESEDSPALSAAKEEEPSEESKELAIWRSGRVPLLIEQEKDEFIVSDKTFTRESMEKLKELFEEPSCAEADELVKIAFLEWSNSPSANSAIANLRNKLCTVIGEREDLKRELARIKEQPNTIALPMEKFRRYLWVLRQIMSDIPTNRDWLNPDVEKEAFEILTTALSQQPTKPA